MFQKAKQSCKELHFLKFKYFNTLSGANWKDFWKTVKLLQTTIPSLHHNNIQAVDDKVKSNLLNEFLQGV